MLPHQQLSPWLSFPPAHLYNTWLLEVRGRAEGDKLHHLSRNMCHAWELGVLGAAPLLSTLERPTPLNLLLLFFFLFLLFFFLFLFFFPFPVLQQLAPAASCPLGRVRPAGCTATITSLRQQAAAGVTPRHLPDPVLLGASGATWVAFSSPTGITVSVGSGRFPTIPPGG